MSGCGLGSIDRHDNDGLMTTAPGANALLSNNTKITQTNILGPFNYPPISLTDETQYRVHAHAEETIVLIQLGISAYESP